MHLKLDENVPIGLIHLLKEKGFEASSAYSQGLSGAKDGEIALHCKEKKFVLITLDNDFSHILVYPPKEYEGIVVIRSKSQGLFSIMKLFEKLLKKFDMKNVKHKTLIVEEKHIKVRE